MSDLWDDLVEEAGDGERAHSRFAPSALKRILSCPRSVALAEAVRAPGRSSVYAAEGSVAHTIAEAWLRGNPDDKLVVGKIVAHDGHDVVVTKDMHDHGRDYAKYVRGLMQPGDHLYVENTVRLDTIVGEDANMYGHLDAAVWSPSRRLLIVIDYKYGRGIRVSALDNPQLKAYALGAMFTLGEIDPDEVRYLEAHVFQPRLPSSSQPDKMHVLDLLDWGHGELAPVVAAIQKDGALSAPYVTGDHCRFCPALSQCPAIRDRAVKAAQKAFEDKPIPPSALSDDELAAVLDEVDIVEAWFEAARAEGLRRAEAGRSIAGRKLVEAKGRRVWKDEEDVGVWAAVHGYTPNVFLTQPELKTVPQMEKSIRREDQESFNELWTFKSNGNALVPASDKRPPVRVKPAHEVFKDATPIEAIEGAII